MKFDINMKVFHPLNLEKNSSSNSLWLDWKFSHKKWTVPNAGDLAHPGLIKDLESNLVLGLFENNGDDKSQVILQDTKDQNMFTQKWVRSKPNQDGWFTLQNSGSRDYLAVISNDEILTSGKIIVLFNNCFKCFVIFHT